MSSTSAAYTVIPDPNLNKMDCLDTSSLPMRVLKRGNRGYEEVDFNKITKRIKLLTAEQPRYTPRVPRDRTSPRDHAEPRSDIPVDTWRALPAVAVAEIARDTVARLYDGITTSELDKISADLCEERKLRHPDYGVLAARVLVSNLHKNTPASFSQCMREVAAYNETIIAPEYLDFICANAAALDAMIDHQRDYLLDYMGFRTLENGYLLNVEAISIEYLKSLGRGGIPADTLLKSAGKQVIGPDGRARDVSPSAAVDTRGKHIIDRPQYMYMRIAIAVNYGYYYLVNTAADTAAANTILDRIREHYNLLSEFYFTHATPTLFNSCSQYQQLNSCFLLGTGDSIEEIMRNASNAAFISKRAGGIGIHMSNIRPQGSVIASTRGISSGLPKQLKLYNDLAVAFDQGGKRPGAIAIYLEPWQGDVLRFLEMKLPKGDSSMRALDLFYALWMCDLFMRRAIHEQAVENSTESNPLARGRPWSLFSERDAPGLSEIYDGMRVCARCNYCANKAYYKYFVCGGCVRKTTKRTQCANCRIDGRTAVPTAEQAQCIHVFIDRPLFTELYERYEREGRATKQVPCKVILRAIFAAQQQTGTPYICYKDATNRMSNQANVGTIKSSNLCTEIMEWSSDESYACCTLASINLRKFVRLDATATAGTTANADATFDFDQLRAVVAHIVEYLDSIIAVNDYPVPECIENSTRLRPIGIGVQALADVFALLGYAFDSPEAARLDLRIFETIYYAAIDASCTLAQARGPYAEFAGSPASEGALHPDLWLRNQEYMVAHACASAGAPVNTLMPDFMAAMGITSIFAVDSGYNWPSLRERVRAHGLRQSLHVALMPTVSTSQIMGNNESFEPFPALICNKSTQAGQFTVVNKHLQARLIADNLWSDTVRYSILDNYGSVSNSMLPDEYKRAFRISAEIPQSHLIKRAALRAAFVDQSASLNIRLVDNNDKYLYNVLVQGWQLGLKTGSYYIRTDPAARPLQANANTMRSGAGINNSANTRAVIVAVPPDSVTGAAADDVCPIGCTSCSS